MQYYTVVGDSYDEAVKKARSLYGDGIRIHSRRDYTTGGGLFTKRRQHCEIVCYLAHGGGGGRSGERDISEFAAEAKTPDPSTLTTSEMLDTEIHRTRTENPEAARMLDQNHITDPLRSTLLESFPSDGDAAMILSDRILKTVGIDYGKQIHPRHFVVFVGPTGSGKTTTLAKVAYLYGREERSVGIITLDSYRTGAYDQIAAFGTALSIPVLSAGAEDELIRATEKFSWKDTILIDTMGLSPKDKELNLRLRGLLSMLDGDRTDYIMTVSANQSAVKSDIPRPERGDRGQFRTDKVLFPNPVTLMKDMQNIQFDPVFHLIVGIWQTAHQNVERLSRNHRRGRARHLIPGEMRQQIVDIKNRIRLFLSDPYFYRTSIG